MHARGILPGHGGNLREDLLDTPEQKYIIFSFRHLTSLFHHAGKPVVQLVCECDEADVADDAEGCVQNECHHCVYPIKAMITRTMMMLTKTVNGVIISDP